MKLGPHPAIVVTSSVYKDPRPITIAVAYIIAVGQDGTDPEDGGWISTGPGVYRVRESYGEILEKVSRA